MAQKPIRIIGIDPGSQVTGYGVLDVTGDNPIHVAHGVIKASPNGSFFGRLAEIERELSTVMTHFKPQIAVIEKIFLGKNADSAFKLGHVRGVCVLTALQAQAEVFEYATRSVKKGITGTGAATKEQVQMILFAILKLRTPAVLDASDALALAYYHARQQDVTAKLNRALAGARNGMEGNL